MAGKSTSKISVKRLVTRNGKTFVQTFHVNPEEYKAHKKKTFASTQDIHKVGGKYSTERKKLHKKIIGDVVRSCPKPMKGQKPQAVLLLGGAASGKSTVVNKILKPNLGTNFGTMNVDDIKESIPEYTSMMRQDVKSAANRVHTESSDMGKVATSIIINQGRNFIYDGTLSDEGKATQLIDTLKSKGYDVRLVGVNVNAEDALHRAELRAFGNGGGKAGSGRFVPNEVLLGAHKGSSAVFEKIKSKVDYVELYDNNVALGDTPIKVMEGGKVYDKTRYDSFKQKANLNISEMIKTKNKESISKAFDELDISKGKSDSSWSQPEKTKKNEEMNEVKEAPPTPKETSEAEHEAFAHKRDEASSKDKEHSFKKLGEPEKKALRILAKIEGKSPKEKIEAVESHFGVSKLHAINLLSEASHEAVEAEAKEEGKEKDGEEKKGTINYKDATKKMDKKRDPDGIEKEDKKKDIKKAFDFLEEGGDDISKSIDISSVFGSHDEQFKFSKSGKEIKEKLAVIRTSEVNEVQDCINKMNAYQTKIGILPLEQSDDYNLRGYKHRLKWIPNKYSYKQRWPKEVESTPDPLIVTETVNVGVVSNEMKNCMSDYNNVSSKVGKLLVSIIQLDSLNNNLKDKGSYKLGTTQLSQLGF